MTPRFILTTPVLPWPVDQGSKHFQLEVARGLLQVGPVAWVTREIGDQVEARRHLTQEGFQLVLDDEFVPQDPWSRLRRRAGIDWRAWRQGHPREQEFIATPRVQALAAAQREAWPDAVTVGAFWHVAPVVAAGPVGRRVMVLSDVEYARAQEGLQCAGRQDVPASVHRLRRGEERAFAAGDLLLALTEYDLQLAREALGDGGPSAAGLWPATIPIPPRLPSPAAATADEPLRLLTYGHWEAPFNRDGLTWFLQDAWPQLREQRRVELRVVGAGLDADLTRRVETAGAVAVGWADDVAVELAACHAVVVALRFAGGLRYRMLEAMAHGRPTLCTPVAARGVEATAGRHFLRVDTIEDWLEALDRLRQRDVAIELAGAARAHAQERFGPAGWGERVRAALAPVLGER